MRTDHLHKFIDRKIDEMINNSHSLGEIYDELDRRVLVAKRSNMRPAFVLYVEYFCGKRKRDFQRVYNSREFGGLDMKKVFKLIQLKDKLSDSLTKEIFS